jgi:hypothetical protein
MRFIVRLLKIKGQAIDERAVDRSFAAKMVTAAREFD